MLKLYNKHFGAIETTTKAARSRRRKSKEKNTKTCQIPSRQHPGIILILILYQHNKKAQTQFLCNQKMHIVSFSVLSHAIAKMAKALLLLLEMHKMCKWMGKNKHSTNRICHITKQKKILNAFFQFSISPRGKIQFSHFSFWKF